MNAKYIIGIIIIAGFLIWGGTAFMKTTIQYVSIDEAATSDKIVQVMGKIDFDAVNYDEKASRLEFRIFDPEAESPVGSKTLDIVYYDVVPGNFDQATSVVLKGKPDATGKFVAEQMLVKCPSKYQGDGDEYQDASKHDEAVEG